MKISLPFLVATCSAAVLAGTTGCMSTADANSHRMAGGAVPIFEHLDSNRDGKVTYAEFDAGFADTIFSTYNRDTNGTVTKMEWDSIERANQDKAKSSFLGLDRNHDGKLTREELTHRGAHRNAVVKRLFARIDANHDGVITLEEARAFGIQRASDRDPANHP